MSFGSPESSKEFPGLYGHERHSDSDSEAQASKQLIGKRKDKKDKDIGYAALGDSSGDEDEDGKSPLRGKLGNPFKFSKKEKREKDKQKEHKEKEVKTKEVKEKDLKVRKDARELYREEKLKEKEKHKEEKHKEKEKMKEEKEKMKEKTKEKTKEDKSKEKSKETKELKHKESIKETAKEASEGRSKRKKKEQAKSSERKKSVPALAEEDEPVFGVPLALAVERSKCHDGILLPAVVRECIDYIEQNGLNCEGIYRLSGVKSKVQQLKRGYNQRDTVCLYDHEPHTVASLLKLFLRELPEPVLTAELLPLFDAAAGQKAPERRVQQLSELLARLPDPNRLLVQYMFKHMEHIIKREKINKMNVQNVSLVLSPTMQISHRVLNAFFLYGKILFSGVAIKRYVPPIADGELPDTAQAISEEIDKQESLLSQLHQQLKSGSITQRREEQLWEAQRILTQLKRRQRFVTKRSETETAGKPADTESGGEAAAAASSDDSAAPASAATTAPAATAAESAAAAAAATVAAATAPQKLERTVQIINEDNVTVIQIGEKSAPTAAIATEGDEEATAESKPAAESDGASPKPTEAATATAADTAGEGETEAGAGTPSPPSAAKVQREGKKETDSERKTSSASLPAEVRQKPQISEPAPEQAKSVPELDRAETVSPAEAEGAAGALASSLPPAGDESQASFSDLHRRIVASVGSPAEPTAPTALPTVPQTAPSASQTAPPAAQAAVAAPPSAAAAPPTAPPPSSTTATVSSTDPLESEQTAELLRQLILLKLEEDELVSTGRELRSRLAAERSEIGRLKDTIHEMETLYKYRTYSVDSSDDSSGDDSDGSDTEEEMLRQLREVIRHNQQIEAKNAQLVRAIHEERRLCQKRRAQIRYLELQSSGQ